MKKSLQKFLLEFIHFFHLKKIGKAKNRKRKKIKKNDPSNSVCVPVKLSPDMTEKS